jgi:hypothetical protein
MNIKLRKAVVLISLNQKQWAIGAKGIRRGDL